MKRKMIPFKIGAFIDHILMVTLLNVIFKTVPITDVIEENPQFSTPPVSGRGARVTSSEQISPGKPVQLALTRDGSRRSIELDYVYPSYEILQEAKRSVPAAVAERYVAHLMHQFFEKLERERGIVID